MKMEEYERPSWVKTLIIIIIVVIGLSILISVLGFGTGMMGGGMMGGGMMGFGWLFILLPIILIIALIYGLTGRETDKSPQPTYYGGNSQMEVLERRYANGEISRGEYLRIKEDLRRN
jgi:putative membrane protein